MSPDEENNRTIHQRQRHKKRIAGKKKHDVTTRSASLILTAGSEELRLTSSGTSDNYRMAAVLLKVASRWRTSLSAADEDPANSGQPVPPPRYPRVPSFNAPALNLCVTHSFCTTDLGDENEIEALGRLTKDEREHLASLALEDVSRLCNQAKEVSSHATANHMTPLRFRVLSSRLSLAVKQRICTKLERISDGSQSSEASKYAAWVEACLSIPIGKLVIPDLSCPLEDVLRISKKHLDSVVYGHRLAKQAVLERVFSWYTNPTAAQRPLAFCGAPGNGKTTLAKHGLSPLLKRPLNFVSLGGAHDCSTLVGHGYTFEGSQPGRIVECLASSHCMNPIIYFDELDKVSGTLKGEEIINVLVHLTDSTQNEAFRDRFLNGIDLNLSCALLVFSFNDISKVPRVLLERMQVVQMEPFSHKAQKEVVQSFLMPQALARSGCTPGSIVLEDHAVETLLEQVSASSGLRGALDVIDQLVTKAYLWMKVKDGNLIYPLIPKHFSEDAHGNCTILSDAVRAVCSDNIAGCRPQALSMYS